MFIQLDEQLALFRGDFFHVKSHMKLLEFIIEFSEKEKQRKLANETSKKRFSNGGRENTHCKIYLPNTEKW